MLLINILRIDVFLTLAGLNPQKDNRQHECFILFYETTVSLSTSILFFSGCLLKFIIFLKRMIHLIPQTTIILIYFFLSLKCLNLSLRKIFFTITSQSYIWLAIWVPSLLFYWWPSVFLSLVWVVLLRESSLSKRQIEAKKCFQWDKRDTLPRTNIWESATHFLILYCVVYDNYWLVYTFLRRITRIENSICFVSKMSGHCTLGEEGQNTL